MAKIPAKTSEKNEPVNIGDRAIDNLRFIRETMERSAVFTSVPGYGGILMGATAIGASIVAAYQTTAVFWLLTWLVEAALAFFIGLLTMWQKSKIGGTPLTSAPARKFAFGFAPPLIVGALLSAMFYKNGWFEALPSVWLLLYGAAVVCGGASSVRVVPTAGWCFVALGAVSIFLPAAYGNLLMALGFGVLHIVFGIIVARKFGG
jgi:hypothetical protein